MGNLVSETKNSSLLNKDLRFLALKRLGAKCSYPGCEWFHPDVLQIDHIISLAIANKGDKGRQSSLHTLRQILAMEHPEHEFQILCANHHRLKTVRDLEEIVESRRIESEIEELTA